MGKPYFSCSISGWFYFLYYKFIYDDSAMNLLEEEDGQVMYFKNEKEARLFLQDLYDERGFGMEALIDDMVQLMRVQ